MCRVLEVSESGYHAWCQRFPSQRQREDARLTTQIQDLFVRFRGVYGSPRLLAELRDLGWSFHLMACTHLLIHIILGSAWNCQDTI
jgi:hypothetical protein